MGPCVCSCQFIQNKDTKVLDTSINEQCNKIQKFSNRAKEESNESYFSEHYLPSPLWRGWSPKIDLRDVKAKAIKNERLY